MQSSVQQLTVKSQIQIEVEKLKWELKNNYQDMGKYVTPEKTEETVMDFTHDPIYIQKINEIIKIKYYINERLKSRGASEKNNNR